MDLKNIYDNLTDEQKEMLKTCKDMDEFMQLAGEWGIELPDELVAMIAGGKSGRDFPPYYYPA